MSVTGPALKQRRLGLLDLNVHQALRLFASTHCGTNFYISKEETSCISPSCHRTRPQVRCLQVHVSTVTTHPWRLPMPDTWDSSVNLSRGCTGLFHSPERVLPPSSPSADHLLRWAAPREAAVADRQTDGPWWGCVP